MRATTDLPKSVRVRPICRTGQRSRLRNIIKAKSVPTVSVPVEIKMDTDKENDALLQEDDEIGNTPIIGQDAQQTQLAVAVELIGLGKLTDLKLLPGKGTHDSETREIFLHHPGHLALCFIHLLKGVHAHVQRRRNQKKNDRPQQHKRRHRHTPVEENHERNRCQKKKQGIAHIDHLRSKSETQRLHIRSAALDRVAGVGFIVIG